MFLAACAAILPVLVNGGSAPLCEGRNRTGQVFVVVCENSPPALTQPNTHIRSTSLESFPRALSTLRSIPRPPLERKFEVFRKSIDRLTPIDSDHLTGRRWGFSVQRSDPLVSFLEDMENYPLKRGFEKIGVTFTNETGLDTGGPRRELFQLMAEKLCDPKLYLLAIADDGRYEVIAGAELKLYEVLGRLITLALVNGDVFPITFVTPFYKQLLGVEVGLEDLDNVDPVLFQSLMSLQNTPMETLGYEIDGVEDNNKTTYIK
jgi:hypothetical protein